MLNLCFLLILSWNLDSVNNDQARSLEDIRSAIHGHDIQRAQILLDQLDDLIKENKNLRAQHFLYQGILRFEEFDFNEAVSHLEQSRIYFEKNGANSWEHATALLYIGRVYKDGFFNSKLAEKYYADAKKIYLTLPEAEANVAEVSFQQARAQSFNNIENRLFYNLQAMRFYEKDPKKYWADLAECHNLEAIRLMYKEGFTDRVKNQFNRAIQLAISGGLNDARKLGKYYDNLGYLYGPVDRKLSLKYLNMGLKQHLKFNDNEYWISTSLLNLGSYYLDTQNFDSANYYFKSGLKYRKELFGNFHPEISISYQHIAACFQQQNNIDSAYHYYQKALFQKPNDTHIELPISKYPQGTYLYVYADIVKELSRLLVREYDRTHDIQTLKIAFDYNELINKLLASHVESYEWENAKISYSRDFRAFYENYIEVSYLLFKVTGNQSYARSALSTMESLRYTSVLENTRSIQQSYIEGSEQQLYNRLIDAKGELAFYAMVSTNSPSNPILESKFVSARKKYNQIKDSIPQDRTEKKVIDFNQLTNDHSGSIFIEYWESVDHYYAISLSRGGFFFLKLNKPPHWNTTVQNFMQAISRPPKLSSFQIDRSKFSANAGLLYQVLIAPFENSIRTSDRLIIVPDGVLHQIPFEILLVNSTGSDSYATMNYLNNTIPICKALSLNLLLSNKTTREMNKVVAFGATVGAHALPKAGDEIEAIKEFFNVDENTARLCNLERFNQKTELDGSILHLAVHGEQDTTDILKSRLIFSGVIGDTLYAHDLYRKKINSPLVVLSACESGLGINHDGEGVFSISRAFTYAGAGSILMTLWKVDDNRSANLMSEFYKFLKSEGDAAVALALSKKAILSSSDEFTSHPYYWAGYTLVGQFNKSNSRFEYIGFLLLVPAFAILIWFLTKRKSSAFVSMRGSSS